MNHARNRTETSFQVYSPTLWFSNGELYSKDKIIQEKDSNSNNDIPVFIPSDEKLLFNYEVLKELLEKPHSVM